MALRIEVDWNVGPGATQVAEFVGWATPGSATSAAVWRIIKIVYDTNDNPLQVLWADGNEAFDNIWDNRAALAYS